ncbi:PHP domain-containing protein [Patescibacteria group bacterium AH-259-L05]|nr:PHP domain-containing protein [Patescibacteria group bacterium AH-259-L05]
MSKHKYPKGSKWRKWDLHVHTPASYDWGGGNITPDDLVDKAIKVGLKVIAITDHHSVGWLDAVGKAGKKKDLVVLPGVELRTDKGNKGVHIIGIFNEGVKAKFIYDKILSPLGLSDADVKSKGNEQIYCNYEDACKLIKQEGGLVFLHAGNKHCGIEQLDSDARSLLKKDMAYLVDVLEVSNDTQLRKYYEKVFPNVGREWPIIITSDSIDRSTLTNNKGHSLEVLGKAFIWIKADMTFEGLRQIVYEPQLRVRLQEEDPAESETYASMYECSVAFPDDLNILTDDAEKKESDFCLQGEYTLSFSNNLTCIIGGRGSGKSTLVHILFNSWNRREDARLDKIGSPLFNLDLRPDPLTKVRMATQVDIPEDTEFFLQNEIEKHARNIDEMSSLIRYRLENLSSIADGGDKKNLKELRDACSTASSTVDELISAYDTISISNKQIEVLRKNINTLRKQTEVIKSKEYKAHKKAIEDVSEKISSFRKYKKEYESLIEDIEVLEDNIKSLDWQKYKRGDLLASLQESLAKHKEGLVARFTDAQSEYDKKKYHEKLKAKKQELKKYLEGKGLSPENIEELADATEQINDLESQITSLEEAKEPHETIYSEKDSILANYREAYISYHDRFFEVGSNLEERLDDLSLSNKRINFEQRINLQPLRNSAAEFVKENVSGGITIRTDEIQNVLFDVDDIAKYEADKNSIRKTVNESQKAAHHKKVLQELVNDDVFLNRLHLRILKSYFDIRNIQVQTKLGEKLLQNTSFGERCGIVITIALLAGTNPIVIDQPEDNLDGKFISTVLVPLIRRQKENRQIILVTRDANIAIGSDAELIVILEEDGNKVQLISSSIENIRHREKYIWILDGGKEAFQKREQKYRLGFLTLQSLFIRSPQKNRKKS